MDKTLKPYLGLSWKDLEATATSLQNQVNTLSETNRSLKIALKDAEDARESATIAVTGVRRTNRYLGEGNRELNERVIMLEKLLETARKNNMEKDKTIEELNAHKLILEDTYESLSKEAESYQKRIEEFENHFNEFKVEPDPCCDLEPVEEPSHNAGANVVPELVQHSERNKITLLKHIVHQMVESL